MCVCLFCFPSLTSCFIWGRFFLPFAPALRVHCACVPPRSPHTQAVNGPEQFPRDIVHVRRVVYKRTGFCTRDSIKMKQTIILEFICRANCQSRFGATRPRPSPGRPFVHVQLIAAATVYIFLVVTRSPYFIFILALFSLPG